MDRKGRKTVLLCGEVFRCIEPIKCDFCSAPQKYGRFHCEYCGSSYSDSKFNVNRPPTLFGWNFVRDIN
jgi:hypothetical protein